MTGTQPILECRALRKRFGERTAVDGVSFSIAPGETYGLLGPNDAGKTTTTTISMICGLLRRDGGEVLVGGRPIDVSATDAKPAIGFVPQDLAIYPVSARENLRFFGRLQRLLPGKVLEARVAAVLELTGLAARADEHTDRFSGGMKRRLNIGVGLLHGPKLLVLDEPTVGSTRRAGTRSSRAWPTSSRRDWPSSTRPTTWRRPSACATGSGSSTRAGSGPRGRGASSSGYRHLVAGFPATLEEESMTRLVTEVRPRLERIG